ncbi:uroporphyrinogen-III synthase-like [Periplaneta americana]|uniref:uroporphyrinogen-III synthase-like n=1 Tax=Periplaneta americana TaxID=6978 RepID=UPI0037E7403E
MKVARGEVLIFKAPTEDSISEKDPYKKRIEEAGYKTSYIPVLDFEYFNLNKLLQHLQNPEKFSGLIFTSPRAVKAVACLTDASALLEVWRNHPTFVVGEGTANVLKNELNLCGQGSGAGNAGALADIILQNRYEYPLLFPCGNLKRDELPTRLAEGGVNLVQVTVYRTQVHQQLEQRLQEVVHQSDGFPEVVVYFSPSGLKFTVPILHKLEVPLEELKFVAIGPTTQEAILDYNLKVWSVASRPTPEHLLEAVLKC